jgi:hypothetical protein
VFFDFCRTNAHTQVVMTVLARGVRGTVETVLVIRHPHAVHLIRLMTFHTVHTGAEVDISGEALVGPVVFILDTTAVTGRTVTAHRRRFHEIVALQQPTTDREGLADMAIATGCMAFIAMTRLHHFEVFVVFWHRAGM